MENEMVKTVLHGFVLAKKQSGNKCILKIRCRPERRRLRLEISIRPVESLFPLDRGESLAGASG